MMSSQHKALVIGGLGVTGSYIINELQAQGGWDVTGVARSAPAASSTIPFISVDISEQQACHEALSVLQGVTHIFFSARNDKGDHQQQSQYNLKMLSHVVEAVDHPGNRLRHIHLMHGMKAYGNMLGPFKTPAEETDPRVPLPLTYYAQEDYVMAHQPSRGWAWSSLRPGGVCGMTLGYSGNIVTILGIYGSICKAMGWPLWFPGSPAGFDVLRQVCNADVLAKAAVWVSTRDQCANQAFNVHNGDVFRWRHLWPQIARFFDIEPAGVVNLNLRDLMKDKAPVWEQIVKKHQLKSLALEQMVSWEYSQVFHKQWDSFANANRLHQSGFRERADTAQSMMGYLQQLRQERIIP
jgi:nucleoside-diphosphate-sugar epimerase